MELPSELEAYLKEVSSQGETVDTEQTFSLAREKALEKLATYQMPFEGAWALKVVQAAVAARSVTSIKVTLGIKETCFAFSGSHNFELSELEQAFFDPEYAERTDLIHLITALRVIGYHQMHPFWLGCPREGRVLIWDGDRMTSVAQNVQGSDWRLIVSNFPKGVRPGLSGWVEGLKGSGMHAELTKLLTQRAFMCPIPLTVDGRRIDALQNDPHQGWGPESQVLLMGFKDSKLPKFCIPRYTFDFSASSRDVETGLEVASEKARTPARARSRCSLAYLFAAHVKRHPKARTVTWIDSEANSYCHWVLDGVVVQSDLLTDWASFCSVGGFVSAQGLATDLTGFHLQDSADKEARLTKCKELLDQVLDDASLLDFDKMARLLKREQTNLRRFMLVIGAFMLVAKPPLGILWEAFTVLTHRNDDSMAEKRKLQVEDSVRELKIALESRPRLRR